jgi:hypothetical protein
MTRAAVGDRRPPSRTGGGLEVFVRSKGGRLQIRVGGSVTEAAVAEARLSAALLQRSLGLVVEVERAREHAAVPPR